MPHSDLNTLRTQLIRRGYRILPNRGKVPIVKSWNSPEFIASELSDTAKGTAQNKIARWPDRFPDALSTGLLIMDGIVVVDIDVDDREAVSNILAALPEDVMNRGPTRYGKGEKCAVFCRLADGEEPFVRLASRAFGTHRVEVFGGKKLRNGNISRQFGIYGPHSYNEDGTVALEYAWADPESGLPALHEIDAVDLPEITVAQIHALIDRFEQTARELGWQETIGPATEVSTAAYDITETTRFDTDRAGRGLSYTELCEAYAACGDLRCASNFIEGRSGTGTSRCWVFWSPRHDCVAVFVYGDEVTHYPAEMAAGGLGDEPIVLGPDAAPDPKLAAWRERYAHGAPKASLYNARLAIEGLGLRCSHDTFHNQLWIGRSDAARPSDPRPAFLGQVTDAAIGGLRWLLSDTYGLDFTEKHVRDAVNILCGENQFNPVLDMLAEAEASWDGKPRLDRMAVDHFNCADTELNRQMVRKTMIAAVARVRTPGCKFDTILTMEAPEGLNKSSAWAVLAGEGNFSDEPIIGKHGKEVMEQLADVWIHESADLAGLGKREVEAVKSFASRVRDRARPAYGHFLVDQPRHSIEVATTNNEEYLLSQTGNRRFWPIKVQRSIDIQKLKAARLQLWGEAAACQSRGESLVLDEALWSAAGVEQEARRIQHPWEALLANLDTVASGGPVAGIYVGNGIVHEAGTEQRVATSAIFEHVLRVPNGQMHNGHSKALADAMRKLGWSRCVFLLEGKTVKGYHRSVITRDYP